MSSRKDEKRIAKMPVRVKPDLKLAIRLAIAEMSKRELKTGRVTEDDVIREALRKAFPEQYEEAMETARELEDNNGGGK